MVDSAWDVLSVEVEPGVRYCFDDTYMVDASILERNPMVLTGLRRRVYVDKMTRTIEQYNKMTTASPIKEKVEFDVGCVDSSDWKIPAEYKALAVGDIVERLLDRQTQLNLDVEFDRRSARIATEMKIFVANGYLDMLKLMCYIVDVMTQTKQVWGVGRGSSVSSYVLFLIGVHDIDSVKHDLEFTDFMKL